MRCEYRSLQSGYIRVNVVTNMTVEFIPTDIYEVSVRLMQAFIDLLPNVIGLEECMSATKICAKRLPTLG